MKNIKKVISTFAIGVIMFSNVVFAVDDIKKDEEFFEAIKEYIMVNYNGDVSEEDLYDGAVRGMFEKLDKHSIYMDAKNSSAFMEEVSGKIYGIGALLGVRENQLKVIQVTQDSPAQKAGMLQNDIIIKVDNVDTSKVNQTADVIDYIKGDKGTTVSITVLRGTQKIEFKIVRDEIKVNPVSARILDNNIGYIEMTEFNENISDEVDKVVKDFVSKGVKKVILDVRSNPGGSLREAVNVADYFVPEGRVVSLKYKNGVERGFASAGLNYFEKVAVLVDNGSASASEILAGAIQDTKSGIIIGEVTYGKGTVQNLMELKNGETIKLTIASYYLPSGRTINDTGLVPDIIVPRFSEDLNLTEINKLDENKELKKDDAGIHVLALQERLNIMGYKIGDAKGIYGISTVDAVKSFQRDNNINQDGIANKQTIQKIGEKFADYLLSDEMDNQLNKAIEILSK